MKTGVLDEMVRDFCKVGPKPKSEVRRRIAEFAESETAGLRALVGELARYTSHMPNCILQTKFAPCTCGLAEIIRSAEEARKP